MTIRCDTCGELEYGLIDGYNFGDRLLEDVMFRVAVVEGVVTVTTDPLYTDYMASLNEAKWLEKAKAYAEQEDTLQCPKCGGDIDGLTDHDVVSR